MGIRRKSSSSVVLIAALDADDLSAKRLLAVQQALGTLDYYLGPEDGQNSPDLEASLTDMQFDCGLPMTGEADRPTRRMLQRLLLAHEPTTTAKL